MTEPHPVLMTTHRYTQPDTLLTCRVQTKTNGRTDEQPIVPSSPASAPRSRWPSLSVRATPSRKVENSRWAERRRPANGRPVGPIDWRGDRLATGRDGAGAGYGGGGAGRQPSVVSQQRF